MTSGALQDDLRLRRPALVVLLSLACSSTVAGIIRVAKPLQKAGLTTNSAVVNSQASRSHTWMTAEAHRWQYCRTFLKQIQGALEIASMVSFGSDFLPGAFSLVFDFSCCHFLQDTPKVPPPQ